MGWPMIHEQAHQNLPWSFLVLLVGLSSSSPTGLQGRVSSELLMGQWRSLAKEAMDRGLIVANFCSLLHITNTYLCSCNLVHGPSMLPTLNVTGDVVITEHVSHRLGKLGRGDLVLVRSPENPGKIMTKRIVGMEGDRVSYFLDPNFGERCRTAVVPKGHVWIQGDNIYVSNDSRHFGPVPYGLIQGKVFLRVWPPDGFGLLGND
ncbi:mitochondrial ATP-independent inner membrane protease subunit 1a [Cannabis sativa]|uniref:mitochondrial ATP-independent inner membrane protease subunit 1a n=1 Tax=Cannabis sativa TaxID=3483 RepID=UPI0029CA14F0|nr:mitochondrial ATP-independent inner membrane protease subunit 1a [Cannabis sativa]